MNFIIIKILKTELKPCGTTEFFVKKLTTAAGNDLVFNDFLTAKDHADKIDFSYVILARDFEHWLSRSDLIQKTALASYEHVKNITNNGVLHESS